MFRVTSCKLVQLCCTLNFVYPVHFVYWNISYFILQLMCFSLDLVPINRSVGLKAKPTKPVTEVLRPVVAKYGLNLNELVARLVSIF